MEAVHVALVLITLIWCAIHPLLLTLRIVPADLNSRWFVVAQGAVIGLAAYLVLKFFLVAVFALHLVNSYVYLGEFPLWNFVNLTARDLLRPIKWIPLQAGKIDFAPAFAIVVVLLCAQLSQQGLTQRYTKGGFEPPIIIAPKIFSIFEALRDGASHGTLLSSSGSR